MTTIVILHNFCINERLKTNLEANTAWMKAIDCEFAALRNYESDMEYQKRVSDEFPGWSLQRQRMVHIIKEKGVPGRETWKKSTTEQN